MLRLPRVIKILTLVLLLLIVGLCHRMVSGPDLLVETTEVDIDCKGFLALNKLKIQVFNDGLLPRLTFLEIRSPVRDDYLLSDFKVLSEKSWWKNKLAHWFNFPRRTDQSILYPLIVFSNTHSTLEIQIQQVIRDGLSLPRLDLSGQRESGLRQYRIQFDARYKKVRAVSGDKNIEDANHPLEFSIPAEQKPPQFEWDYTRRVNVYEFMG